MITSARFRAFLLTTALGLASVNFSDFALRQYTLASIPIPQTTSGTLIVRPQSDRFPLMGGGGGASGGPTTFEELRKRLSRVTLTDHDFTRNEFEWASISESDFSGSRFGRNSFFHAEVMYSSFIGSRLANSDLRHASFHGCDFSNADLSNADLSDANLNWSDFTGADLSGTDIGNADLSDARLAGARGLTYSQLKHAFINEFTTLPPHLEKYSEKLQNRSKIEIFPAVR